MNKKLKELLKKLPKDEAERVIESVMGADNSKALIEKAKEFGIDLLENEAEELFQLLKKPVELNDSDLALVAGGASDDSSGPSNPNATQQSGK